jgi:hypothetical protein
MEGAETYGQLEQALRAALVAALSEEDKEGELWVYVVDFSDSFVIYRIEGGEYLQDDYTADDDGEITLAGKPTPVKPVTTYEPLGAETGETRVRVLATREGRHLEMLSQGDVGRLIAEQFQRSHIGREVFSGDLVYSPTSPNSYYRDLISQRFGLRGVPGATERLKKHAEQMEQVHKAWHDQALRRLWAGGVEYRVTPDRTDGYGGYFAPPLWLNQLFATANRAGRVLSGLMVRFPLPKEVSELHLPLLSTGTKVEPAVDDATVVDRDIEDTEANSMVVPFTGQADVALQLLEQSPPGAHLDWAIFMDLAEAYDEDLEVELLEGIGGRRGLLGVANIPGIIKVTATETSGSKLWVAMSKLAAQASDARKRPPECWLMRSARWFYFEGSEDTAERPFGLSTNFYLGHDDATPDPISGMMGLPVFPDDAISTTLGAGKNQDLIVCARPRDSVVFEGEPQTDIFREPLSGAGGVRLQMHCNVAAITGRRPASIGTLTGAGLAIQAGW